MTNQEHPQEEDKKEEEQQMSPDVQMLFYFIKIMRMIFLFMILMMINVFFGLYLGFAVPSESTPLRLGLFYTWFGISLAGFIYVCWKMWRKKMPAP
ncbi:hypothetical protein MKQ68_22220 [Chitinophaga horti]|uniref:2TM domain-containing protein n=1 Tax=Chitinophaga horti TaxID=2920382 RepID=A0ABY6IZU3_9BACT|nr:hypothetical protein [Chitinophaga horti]UYQ92800.1 hypothetical protein MKQ68_22220 [Chitinophaga horti]